MELVEKSTSIRIARQCACFNLQKATRAITRVYDQALRPSGLTAGQFLLLAEIKASAPITIKPLAAKMMLHRTALARNLKPLEKKGLITIEPGHDRRERRIHLTGSGQKSLSRAYPFWQHARRNVAKQLGKKQLHHFLSQLSELTVKLSNKSR